MNPKKIVIFFIILTSNFCYSQFGIESSFNSVHIGRNQNLMVNYNFKKFKVAFGVKYNFNKLVNFPYNVLFKKTSYALNTKEHFGINLNLDYNLLKIKDNIFINLFYNFQFSKTHTRSLNLLAVGSLVPPEDATSEYDFVYVQDLNYFGPFLFFENHLGISLDVFFTKNLYYTQRFGGGIMFFKSLDKHNIFVTDGNWEMIEMMSFGLGYKFGGK